jgi:nitrite reductase/ring-hydroxylating ferredoxin subunit/DMSO/TMAO reductase YedYZ heme-binding membrane subunit
MAVSYASILWNKSKKRYDAILWLFIGVFILLSIFTNLILFPTINIATLIIRSFGLLSLVLLHIILSIGPLCRINPKLLPLLYNRRHLGVSMFLVVSVHACLSIFWFHGNGNINPLLSLFTSNTHYDSFLFFPFQTLGFFAYIILMLMAFTSHDFWLAALTPRIWKTLHMLVYLAYVLVILHVVLGVLQFENNPVTYLFLLGGLLFLSFIHIWSGYLSFRFDRQLNHEKEGWLYVCELDEIPNNRAKMINVHNERIAVFKYEGKLSAVHNVCKHQNGPLGEGKIVDGCITCPWHGYQYQPQDGCAPEPFTEKLSTYQLKLDGKKIYVNPKALEEGSFVAPTIFTDENTSPDHTPFYIGWLGKIDSLGSSALKRFIAPAIFIGLIFLLSFTFSQQKIANSKYHFGEVAAYTGQVSNYPFPHILLPEDGKDEFGNPKARVIPLVNAWKFGADSLIDKWCNHKMSCTATVQGTVISRDEHFVLELSKEENSFSPTNKNFSSSQGSITSKGRVTLKGEIIDPKCYFGAMNPGEGKPHRSCAIRCISGGIMPMLSYVENNQRHYAVLLGENGEKINEQVLDFVAEPIQIEGTLYRYENWNYFQINTQNIQRLKN